MVDTSTAPCAVHHIHVPRPAYSELHHVVPQAWQTHWQPPKPWPNAGASPDRPGVTLWDARTIAVCRTGHGNTHYTLVKVMHVIEAASATGADPENPHTWMAALTTARREGFALSRLDASYSMEAIVRFAEAGGKIADLIAHGLWGEI